jgi:aspergillopepsin I
MVYDCRYVFNITIGTPPQTMTLLFDSGSPDFWVWSQQTPECLDKCYNSSASYTAQLFPGQTFYVNYATPGGAEGDVYLDTVVVSAGNNGIMTVEGNPVECATDVFGFFTTSTPAVDGVMGVDRVSTPFQL